MSDIAVLWVALGTPEAATPAAVRRYLREFLTDQRIVEMNPVLWRAILELFILPRRSRVSAAKYASVWYEAGSALAIHTADQSRALEAWLGEHGVDAPVAWAMRYGQPSVADVIDGLRARGVRRLLVVPAYPHYSQTTIGSVYDAVATYVLASRDQVELRLLRGFPTHPGYIEALAASIERHWESAGRPDFGAGDQLLLSYHGIPVAMARAGDPYPGECQATTNLLRARLGLDSAGCRMTYQSKFGPADWLTPATIDTVAELGRAGVNRVDVACPGFAADCLETLEEIGLLNKEAYEAAHPTGVFTRIPCLNADPLFIAAVGDVVAHGLAGWA